MNDTQPAMPPIFAICGKGGVGKTSISASIVKILAREMGKKVLAIDADPAVGLSTSLGLHPVKTVDDIRNTLIDTVKKGEKRDKAEINALLDYEVFDALVESGNIAFLAIGRPETEGCYCQVNHMLKDIIVSLSVNFDYVVIDGEAGIEQVNRRVMEKVSHLVLVSDGSVKGLTVAESIDALTGKAIESDTSGLIVNRIREEADKDRIRIPKSLNLLGFVPEDDTVRRFDMDGESILNLPETPALSAIRDCLKGWAL